MVQGQRICTHMFGQVWAFGVNIIPERTQNESSILDSYLSRDIVIDTLLKARFKTNPSDLSSMGGKKNEITTLFQMFVSLRTQCVSNV